MFKPLGFITLALSAILAGNCATFLRAQGAPSTPASPRVLSYDSDITVNPDATVLVRETVKVLTPGAVARREIYRDILTRYHDRFGNPYLIHIEVLSLDCDGQPGEFRLAKIPDGLRVYMGSSETSAAGEHTYELTYSLDRGIGFFPIYDELYWNVTGYGWALPIEEASTTLHLPTGIARQAILLDAYTGAEGSAETDFTASADNQSNATFRTTRPLGPFESLTVVARWPKGFVHLPTDDQKYRYYLEDNRGAIVGFAGLVVLLIYYGAVWSLLGRTTARGEIEPRSEPPKGFSPAALRYLWRPGFDQKALVADLVDLAVRERLAVLEHVSGSFILGRVRADAPSANRQPAASAGPAPDPTSDEKFILNKLFVGGDTIRLEPAHRAIVGGTVEGLRHHLRVRLEKVYLRANARYLIPGLLISAAAAIRAGLAIQGSPRLLVLCLAPGLLIWSFLLLMIAVLAAATGRIALFDPHHAPTARRQALSLVGILLVFVLGEVAGLLVLVSATSPSVVGIMLVMAAINYAFHLLLESPARSGRALMNAIESLRLFLTSTEKDPGKSRTIPFTPPQLFEKLLPYALALNVEKAWGEKFAASLAQLAKGGRVDYSPAWYSGPGWNPITVATFATTLGNSLSSAISSSATAAHSGFHR